MPFPPPSGGGKISGVTVTGTASAGSIIVATSATTGAWTTSGTVSTGLLTVATASGQSLLVKRGATTSLSVNDFTVLTANNTLDSGNGSAIFNNNVQIASGGGLAIGTAVPSAGGTVATAPPTSATIQTALGSLALGTAFQNTLSYDVRLTVFLSITANTSGVIKLGVGATNTPTQTTIVTGVTTVGFLPVTFKIPAGQFALLSITGTITDSIVGQYLEAA